jgi:hypothetical protein
MNINIKDNIETCNIYSYCDISINKNMLKPIKYQIEEKINKVDFQNELLNYHLEWSIEGKSDQIVGNILYKDFLDNKDNHENKYIFHNILLNNGLYNLIKKYIPLPYVENNEKLRISRFYSGYKYSGSNIHNHTKAINYLINGMKMWILFPNTLKNIFFLRTHNLDYQSNNNTPIHSFIDNYDLLINNIEDLSIIIQEENTVIYIPDFYFHGVINLDDCYGITYSYMSK